jgi:type I restriction enzyme S subunit
MVPPELNEANITQDTVRLAVSGASAVYVREYLRSLGIQRWMAKHTKGMAVRGINLGDLKSMPITLPPRPQQDDFAERAHALENLTALQRKSLTEFDTLFASLQHRAFAGEL